MTNIFLKASGASLSSKVDGKITSGMVGVPVNIEYDSAWDGLTKKVIFRVESFSRYRKNVGTTTTVPWEVLRIHGGVLSVGIEGRKEDGDVVIPTIWATVSRILPGANGEIPGAPNPNNDNSEGASGGNTVIVTMDENNKASYTSQQITEFFHSGDNVIFYNGNSYFSVDMTSRAVARFSVIYDDRTAEIYEIDDTGEVKYFSIGLSGGSAEGAVLYTEQELTDEEKAQARSNLWTKVPSVNMFNPATAVQGSYFNTTTGELVSNANCAYAYIPVTAPGKYIFPAPNRLTAMRGRVALFDSSNNFVRSKTVSILEEISDLSATVVQLTLTESDLVGVASFSFNMDYANANSVMVVAGTEYPTSYIPYAEIVGIPEMKINSETVAKMAMNPLYKKVIAFTGDSICYGAGSTGGYAKHIGENNGMIVQNIGVSGGKITSGTTSFCISESVLNMREDADYVILEGGVNDMAMDNLGTISNNFDAELDTTTFCGAFEQMLKNAIARFPGKKIGYISVHRIKQWAPDDYNTAIPNTGYYEAAIKICKKWGIPVCDLTINCPSFYENDSLKQVYTSNADGWHPNEEGYKKYYVPKIEAWLKTL